MKPRKKLNWLTTLRRLAKPGVVISDIEAISLRNRAGEWPTCACSQLCKKLPRAKDGEPKDTFTAILGQRFFYQIGDREYAAALLTFLKIEKRTALLLRKQAKERKTK